MSPVSAVELTGRGRRIAMWVCLTSLPVQVLILFLMPPGFSGVPFMWLVLAVFATSFGSVAVLERSFAVGAVVVSVFWASWLGGETLAELRTARIDGARLSGTARLVATGWGIHLAAHAAIFFVRQAWGRPRP